MKKLFFAFVLSLSLVFIMVGNVFAIEDGVESVMAFGASPDDEYDLKTNAGICLNYGYTVSVKKFKQACREFLPNAEALERLIKPSMDEFDEQKEKMVANGTKSFSSWRHVGKKFFYHLYIFTVAGHEPEGSRYILFEPFFSHNQQERQAFCEVLTEQYATKWEIRCSSADDYHAYPQLRVH